MKRFSWAGFALLSAASFAGMAACVRVISQDLPQGEVVFFRNFIALLFLLPLMLRSRVSLRTERFRWHLLRAGAGLGAMYLYFYALAHLPLADALLLNYTSPLFITLFAVFWLKESWTLPRRRALAMGLAGVVLLFHPSSHLFSLPGLVGLGSGLLAGLALTTVKRLSGTEPGMRIVVWFALLASVISAVPMLLVFQWPTGPEWGWVVIMGLFGSMGQLGLTRAYRLAPASQVSPMGYASLVFAAVIGYLGWGEVPDATGLLAAAIIIAAGVMVARERVEPAPEPPSTVPVYGDSDTGSARR
ncbi:MAG TPA: DMT family transporter [Mariprofundaceae bacterium]|nr:DMT family transporter [Mariprofundaceae bacterium]